MANEEREFSFSTRRYQLGESDVLFDERRNDVSSQTNAVVEDGTVQPDYIPLPGSAIQQLKMGEGSGTTVGDSINGYDVSLQKDAQWGTDSGSVGGSRVDFPSPPDAIGSEIRLSEDYVAGVVAVVPDSWSSSGIGQVVDGENDSNANSSHMLRSHGGTFEFVIQSGGSWIILSTSPPPTGMKTRVGYRFDGGNLTLFYNGAKDSEIAHSGTPDYWVWNGLGYMKYAGDGLAESRGADIKVDNFINFATSTASKLPSDQWFENDHNRQPWS